MKYIFLSTILLTTPFLAFAQDTNFVPLTNLPGISGISGSPDITTLLNNIYRLCIGAAAVIAVFQIMRAGIMFMFNKGSISENEEAKQLISMSILGLILVLSPVIVFGIINPKILELNFGVENLKTDFRGGVSGTPATPGSGTDDGAVVAPPSVITATGAVNGACPVLQDNQVITEPDMGFKEDCCQRQDNEFVECGVQRRNNAAVTEFTTTCSCQIKEQTINYHDVWENNNGARTKLGAKPPEQAEVNAFIRGCTQNGGAMSYRDIWEGFGDKFRACPSDIVVPAGKTYDCVLIEATCKDDD